MAPNKNSTLPAGRKEAFEALYARQLLGAHETVSGAGSTLMATRHIRKALTHFIGNGFFGSMLDIGCGDFNWMSAVDMRGIRYTGIDCVPALIEQNCARWLEPHIQFEAMDIVKTIPPKYDFILCRDVFTHFPHADITAAFNHIKKSGARHFAVTSFYPELARHKMRASYQRAFNNDSAPGYWRPGNLQEAPFYFPAPLYSIPESQPGKTLDIWRLDDLPEMNITAPSPNPSSPEDFMELAFFRQLTALPFIGKIYLFGSRARNKHRPDSDIDLAIDCAPDITPRQWLEVCNIVDAANLKLPVDCIRYADTLAPEFYDWPLDYKVTLYERPA